MREALTASIQSRSGNSAHCQRGEVLVPRRKSFFIIVEMESDGGEDREEEEASESLYDETDNEVCVARRAKIVPFFRDSFDVIAING